MLKHSLGVCSSYTSGILDVLFLSVCHKLELERQQHNQLKHTWQRANDQFLESQRLLMRDMQRIESVLSSEQLRQVEVIKKKDQVVHLCVRVRTKHTCTHTHIKTHILTGSLNPLTDDSNSNLICARTLLYMAVSHQQGAPNNQSSCFGSYLTSWLFDWFSKHTISPTIWCRWYSNCCAAKAEQCMHTWLGCFWIACILMIRPRSCSSWERSQCSCWVGF